MDPTARTARHRSGTNAPYASRGIDPSSVQDRRLTQEADRFYRRPGQPVVNNPMNGRDHLQGLAQQAAAWAPNPYLDGGGQYGALGLTPSLQINRPADPFARAHGPLNRFATDQLADPDIRRVAPQAGPVALDPGLAQQAPRAWTGDPASPLIPPTAPPAFDERPGMPVTAMPPGMELIGSPADAMLPRPQRSSQQRDTRFGKPSTASGQ